MAVDVAGSGVVVGETVVDVVEVPVDPGSAVAVDGLWAVVGGLVDVLLLRHFPQNFFRAKLVGGSS